MSATRTSRIRSFFSRYWIVILVIICLGVWFYWPSSDSDDQETATTTTTTMTADQKTAWLRGIWTKTYNRVFRECRAKQAAASAAQALPLPVGYELDPGRFSHARRTMTFPDGTSHVELRKVPALRKKKS